MLDCGVCDGGQGVFVAVAMLELLLLLLLFLLLSPLLLLMPVHFVLDWHCFFVHVLVVVLVFVLVRVVIRTYGGIRLCASLQDARQDAGAASHHRDRLREHPPGAAPCRRGDGVGVVRVIARDGSGSDGVHVSD